MNYVKLFALFLLTVFCSFCNAQNKTEQPIGKFVGYIIEDNKGNIWFGADGVYRYDGKTITDFKDIESPK